MKSPWAKYTLGMRLNKQEKEALRGRVFAYMEYHPTNTILSPSKHSRLIFDMIVTYTHTRTVAGVVMIMVVALVTTPLLAENAKPGELLYAVKTKVNEQLRSITLTTPMEKIVFETKLLEKRVAEVQLLVEAGKLDEAAERDLSENIKKHSENIQKSINEMKEQNVDDAEIAQVELSATLTTTNTLVSSLTNTETATGTLRKVVDEIRGDAVAKVASSTEIMGEKVVLHVEQELSKAYELRATIDEQLTDEDAEEIAQRFKLIETMVRVRVATSTSEVNATSTTVTVKPTADEILAEIKTLVVYMNNTAIRSRLSKNIVNSPVEIIEITPATSTQVTEENNSKEQE